MAAWSDTLVWHVPVDLPSAQYALRVNKGTSEDYVPFFVRPAVGQHRAELAYLVSTASYLAYANQRVGFSGGIFGKPTLRHANDAFLYVHEEVGYSLYEHHRDGSGVHFSSRHRPILNLKPRTGTWAFNADTHITAWLEAIGEVHPNLAPLELAGVRIAAVHYPELALPIARGDVYDLVVYGHTHEIDLREGDGTTVLNPGEVGGWLTGRSTVAIVELPDRKVDILDLDGACP